MCDFNRAYSSVALSRRKLHQHHSSTLLGQNDSGSVSIWNSSTSINDGPLSEFEDAFGSYYGSNLVPILFSIHGGEAVTSCVQISAAISESVLPCAIVTPFHPGRSSALPDPLVTQRRLLLPNKCFSSREHRSTFAESQEGDSVWPTGLFEAIQNREVSQVWITPVALWFCDGPRFHSHAFLKELQEHCFDLSIPLNFDECLSGMGRTGAPFSYQLYVGIEPHFVVYGKGHGVCGVAVNSNRFSRSRLDDCINNGISTSTNVCSSNALIAGAAIIRDVEVLHRAEVTPMKVSDHLASQFNERLGQEVTKFGTFFWVTPEQRKSLPQFFFAMGRRGIMPLDMTTEQATRVLTRSRWHQHTCSHCAPGTAGELLSCCLCPTVRCSTCSDKDGFRYCEQCNPDSIRY
jgi:hypothetical protein